MVKMGRPSLYSEDVALHISERLASGIPLRKICSDPAMPDYSTVNRWMEKNVEFREISLRAREVGTHAIADECIDIADNPELDPHDKRIRIDTRLRLIGKWNRRNYGERQEISGIDGGAIITENRNLVGISDLDDEGREALREALEIVRARRAVQIGAKIEDTE